MQSATNSKNSDFSEEFKFSNEATEGSMFLTKRVEDEMKEFRGLKFGNRNLRIFERMFDESHEFLTKKDKYLWRVEKFSITSKGELVASIV